MRAELKSLDSIDAPGGLASFQPSDPANFAITVSTVVGPPDSPGGDLFYFEICIGQWLTENPPEKTFAFLKGHVLLDQWDHNVLERAISDLCSHTEGNDWNDVATKLSRFEDWEFGLPRGRVTARPRGAW